MGALTFPIVAGSDVSGTAKARPQSPFRVLQFATAFRACPRPSKDWLDRACRRRHAISSRTRGDRSRLHRRSSERSHGPKNEAGSVWNLRPLIARRDAADRAAGVAAVPIAAGGAPGLLIQTAGARFAPGGRRRGPPGRVAGVGARKRRCGSLGRLPSRSWLRSPLLGGGCGSPGKLARLQVCAGISPARGE